VSSNWILGALESRLPAFLTTADFGHSWNFAGGLTYGLADKLGLQYQYWGLKSKSENSSSYQ
jgi:hypothetical protein